MRTRLFVAAVLVGCALCLTAAFSVAQSDRPDSHPQLSAEQLVEKVVANELKADKNDHSLWTFDTDTKTPKGETKKEVVETRDGTLYLTLASNGKSLTADESRKERVRLQKLASSPDEARKRWEEESHDSGQADKILALVPKALVFSYGARHDDIVELTFKPNPNFHPDSHEAQVLAAMAGTVRVNTKEGRLAGIDGRLTHEVKFGGGLLGYLDNGGAFHVTQIETQPGHWEMSELRVNMHGRILFFKTIAEQQDQAFSNYRRLPDNFSAAEGVHMLMSRLQAPSEPKQAQAAY